MPQDRQLSVKEMKRILKPDGRIYLSLGAPAPLGYVNKMEWEKILEGFQVEGRGGAFEKWALVTLK